MPPELAECGDEPAGAARRRQPAGRGVVAFERDGAAIRDDDEPSAGAEEIVKEVRPRRRGAAIGAGRRYPIAFAACPTMSRSGPGKSPSTIVSAVVTASPPQSRRLWASAGDSLTGSRMYM